MKPEAYRNVHLAFCLVGMAFAVLPAKADVWTHVWNPAGTGGWQAAGQYFKADGTTPATTAPSNSTDVVMVPAGVTVEVSTDSDATYVNGLKGVYLSSSKATFVFNQPSDIEWNCAVFGAGKIIKRSAATITLQVNHQTDMQAKYYDGYAAYFTYGGIEIEKGMLITPQEGQLYSFGPIVMSNDATFVVSPLARTQVSALDGYGTVSNSAPSGAAQQFQIGIGNASDQRASHFYGRIDGAGLRWHQFATMYLYNSESTFRGSAFVVFGDSYNAYDGCGNLWFTSFGKKGGSSAIGGSYASLESRIGGSFHYLGGGETTDKGFNWRAQTPYQVIMDAGPTGGVTFAGDWYQYTGTPEKDVRMARLRLTGDNEKPCIVSGTIYTQSAANGTNYTTYITKDGTGAWRFSNKNNEQKGALAVKDGTLQFTSIAEQGEKCALGLSTILHEDYYGLRDDSRVVDYAFLLGGSGTFPTFEYMGGNPVSCSTRPLALTGAGGRLASSGENSALVFSGVYSFDAGEKTLMLGGDSIEVNMVSNITPGSGSVAVAKDGPGRWVLHGTNVISGTLSVKEGTLEVWDNYSPKFTWYRLVIKKVFATGNPVFTPEFAMYDDEGSNRVAGLSYKMPAGYQSTDTLPAAYSPDDFADLEPGESICHGADSDTKIYLYKGLTDTVAALFNGTGGSWRMLTSGGGGMPNGTASSYVYVVMRMPEDTPPLKRFDINVGTSIGSNGKKQTIQEFAVEASVDGKNWFALTDDYTVETPVGTWFSGDDFVNGHPLRPNAGFALNEITYDAPGSEHALDAVTSIQVSTGALLVAKGERKTARGLTVDCSTGVGRIEGIDFAAGGTLDLVNLPAGVDEMTLEADLSALTAESIANLNGYAVTKDGRRAGWLVEVTESSIKVFRRGLFLIVR